MARRNTRGLSPLVAILLLIAITVAAAIVISGVFFNLATTAGRRPAAIIDSARLVVSGGAGTAAITIKNTGDVPITGITLTWAPGQTCTPPITFSPIPVQPGGTAAGTGTDTTGCALGATYRFSITVTFQDGSRQVLVGTVTGSVA